MPFASLASFVIVGHCVCEDLILPKTSIPREACSGRRCWMLQTTRLTQKRLRMAPVTDRTSYYMAIPERSLDPNPADGAGLVAHAQALLRFIVGLGWWGHLHPHKNTQAPTGEKRRRLTAIGQRRESHAEGYRTNSRGRVDRYCRHW